MYTYLDYQVLLHYHHLQNLISKNLQNIYSFHKFFSTKESVFNLFVQAEVSSKTVAVTALEEMVGKAREECRRQREEREQSLLVGLEATRKELAEVTEERDSARAELEHLKMESKHSLTRLEVGKNLHYFQCVLMFSVYRLSIRMQ